MIVRYPMVALAFALALVVPVDADHCVTWSTSSPEVDTSLVHCGPSALMEPCPYAQYVDWDFCQLECLFHYVHYEEGNGLPGLQRDDDLKDDTCHGMIEPDFKFF